MYYENEIYGCAFGCPLETRDKQCPFNEIEGHSAKEKVMWMKSLDMEKKESIIEHHLICTKKRENKN